MAQNPNARSPLSSKARSSQYFYAEDSLEHASPEVKCPSVSIETAPRAQTQLPDVIPNQIHKLLSEMRGSCSHICPSDTDISY